MLIESDLVPTKASELPDGPWLIFAPHADDETFGLGGSLLMARNRGVESHVVFVTDGALGGNDESNTLTLIRKRIDEAKQATSALGVKSIQFLGEPDRGLRVCPRLIELIGKIIEDINPSSIFFPTPMEYHPDHRVTTELVWKSLQGLNGFSCEAYSYEISTLAPINLLIDISEVATEKYDIVKSYASQLTQARYLDLVQAIDIARAYSLSLDSKAAEGFFKFAEYSLSIHEQLLKSIRPYFEDL